MSGLLVSSVLFSGGLARAETPEASPDFHTIWSRPVSVEPVAFPAYAPIHPVDGITDSSTGFFHAVQKSDGRWWAIDPLGHGFIPIGVDHVKFQGLWSQKLGYSPYGRHNQATYTTRAAWDDETFARLKTWGFTMLGTGCDPELNHRGLVHTLSLKIGAYLSLQDEEYYILPNLKRPCSAFPNVFHPDFELFCRHRAQQICAPNRDDPWLFGYFIDNELAWWGRDRGGSVSGLFDAVMLKDPDHSAKTALRSFLKKQVHGNIGQFNDLWKTHLNTFDEILTLKKLPSETEGQRAVKRDFLHLLADRYFSITSRAIRDADPNHMVLGARFAGTGSSAPVVWEAAGPYCDVMTFNSYPMVNLNTDVVYTDFSRNGEPVVKNFTRYYTYAKRPILVTEWGFAALDSGLPNTDGICQRFFTQAERAQASSLFARTLLSLPFCLGYDYFMWVDQPALGASASFSKNCNYGLVNKDGVPYRALTDMFTALHRRTGTYRLQPTPEPKPRPVSPAPDAMMIAQRIVKSDAAPARFVRKGAAFRVENSSLVLSGVCGEDDGLQCAVRDDGGKIYGRYNARIQTVNGKSVWTDARNITEVNGYITNRNAVIELAAEGRFDGNTFEVSQQIILPPSTPWYIAQVLRVKNTGTKPLRLKGILFRLESDFDKLPSIPPKLWGIPPSDCWMDSSGRFFGAAASAKSDVRIDFWFDKKHRPFSSVRREMDEIVLGPGGSYIPQTPLTVICITGQGGDAAWMETVRGLADRLSLSLR